MAPDDPRDEVRALVGDLEHGAIGRREFLIRLGKLGIGASAAAALLAPAGRALAASGSPSLAKLVFDGAPRRDRTYRGTNAGGLVGAMPVGRFPERSVPWLAIRAKKKYKIGYSIFNSAYPLPVAFAERGKLDGKLMGVDVLTYDNAGDPAKSLQNAELMVQQGVDFGIHLVLFPDVAERIAKLFDRRGIPQLFYAVAPAKTKKPYLVLPDFGTGFKIGVNLGNYAKKNWAGRVDKLVLMGQKQTGAISDYRTGGGRAGIESVLGKLPDDKVVTLDGGGGLLEESQRAMADWLTANPEPKNILVVGFADTLAVGAVRALEAAGRDKTAAAGGQPGVPDGLNELRKGPEKSAFKVSLVQDLAFASWPVALGIYALEGGKLPDVLTFTAQQYTAANIAKLPSQSNKGYRPRRP